MEPKTTPSHVPVGHEETDVTNRPIALAALVVVTVVLAFAVGVWFFIDVSARHQADLSPPANPLAATFARKEPPEPRLQTHPVQDLASLRAQEKELLGSYAWVDKSAGIVRIPIEEAKNLIAKRGVAALPAGVQP